MNEMINVWNDGIFNLEMSENGVYKNGRWYYSYRLRVNDDVMFEGDDYAPSPLHAPHSNDSIASLLSFLGLRPGDTDDEYFDKYTAKQMDFANSDDCEELSYLAMVMEEEEKE